MKIQNKKAWVTRTIRNGRVKINGEYYRPSEKSGYDGRLDGMVFLFGLYRRETSFVCLHSRVPEEEWPGSACVDGTFPWLWWNKED